MLKYTICTALVDTSWYKNREEYFSAVRRKLLLDRHVYMLIEPGDATRYQLFLLHPHPDQCVLGVVMTPTILIDGGYPLYHYPGADASWTECFAADVVSLVFGHKDRFYSWEHHCPLKVLAGRQEAL